MSIVSKAASTSSDAPTRLLLAGFTLPEKAGATLHAGYVFVREQPEPEDGALAVDVELAQLVPLFGGGTAGPRMILEYHVSSGGEVGEMDLN